MRRVFVALLTVCVMLTASVESVSADDAPKSDQAKQVTEKAEETKAIVPAEVKLGRPVDFEQDVYPILEQQCIACHNLAIPESKLNVEDVAGIMKGGKRGPSVVPKEPEKSLLFQLASRAKGPAMPPLPNKVDAEALSPEQLGILKQWILEGAVSGGGSTGDTVNWQPIPSGLQSIYTVALSPWGRFAACGRTNRIYIYDVLTGEETAQVVDPALGAIQFEGKPMYPDGAAHRDFVHALAFSPDGTMLASGGYRVVKLWKRAENVQKLQAGLPAAVNKLVVSPDQKTAAAALANHSIALVNLADGTVIRTLTGHTAPVTGLAIVPDGARLVSASLDKSIRVWNLADGALVGKLDGPAAFNDLGLTKDAQLVVSADGDNIVRIWGVPTAVPAEGSPVAAPVRELKGHEKPVTSVAVVLPAGTHCVSGSEDGTVRIWQLSDGAQTQALQQGAPVTALAVRPDGQLIAAAGANHIVKLWQVADGKPRAEFKGDQRAQHVVTQRTEAQAIATQQAATADNAMKAGEKDLKEREEAQKKTVEAKAAADKTLEEAKTKEKAALDAQAAAKTELDKKPDDAELKKKFEEAKKAADAQTAAVKSATDAQASAMRSVQAGEQGIKATTEKLAQLKAAKDAADAVHKQSAAGLEEAQKNATAAEKPVRSLAFSADGKKLLTAGDDQLVQLWDANRGIPLETFSGHTAAVPAAAFVGANTLVSCSADQKLIVWDANPAWTLAGQLGPSAEKPLDVSQSPFVSRVLALDFSHDGKRLATGGGDPSRSGELLIWDVEKRSVVQNFKDAHSDTVLSVQFSRDDKSLLSGAADKFVKMFDVASGKHVRSFEGHTHHVLGVAWKGDASLIASAGADNQIKVWNVETGEQTRTIAGYNKQVTAVQFMGVGENIVSCGGDATVRFHKTSDGANYRNFAGAADFMYSTAAARDESLVVSGGEDGILRVWNGANGEVLQTFAPPKPAEAKDSQASTVPAK